MSKNITLELLKYINFPNGFYIECGASDGLFMSNTYTLEKDYNWKGLLIEPSPVTYLQCLKNRDREKNIFVQAALVSDDYRFPTVVGDFFGHAMASVGGTKLNNKTTSVIEVPAYTITKLLDLYHISHIDLFSLDVEGYEMEVLHGLDFNRYRPTYFIIEENINYYTDLKDFMNQHKYRFVTCLSEFNKDEDPDWPGTHQDYLFESIL